ncbi:disintegrin and metalloproteinase domain-containing protein 30-like [Ornithorhynchus anatinus]|uniref:disintegrin and metalloproteinase domain-containing protein 30-like n=1 Tax=Ornithorhynchus anatinus TaxID=9258 RepID=UPI0010A8E02A|nr:disintegrin and metalloproteinase domain-containing protein 30-like [Ornithorhynchus anatinus]
MGAAGTALLLLGLGGLLAAPDDWGFSSSEVVIPRRLTPRGGEAGEPGRLSYLLPLEGRRHVLHLRPKKLLLPRRLPVFTFTARGELLEEQPYVPHGCYYRGAVEGAPGSLATFSTCFRGLWGMLQLHGRLYQVEPLPASATFEHRVSRLDDRPLGNRTCGLTDREMARQLARGQPPDLSKRLDSSVSFKHPKHVELGVVVDHLRFKFKNHNVSEVLRETLIIINFMDSFYEPLNADISLSAIEIWTESNLINVDYKDLLEVFLEFQAWQVTHWLPRAHYDHAHFFAFQKYDDTLGWANVASVCSRTELMASTTSQRGLNLIMDAVLVAHELGHSLGMLHDGQDCKCAQKTCIMNAVNAYADHFSNCSSQSYFDFVTSGAECLNNFPQEVVEPKCGNKLVEKGEECDCGTKKECQEDPCCQPNCKMRPGAKCTSGLCCEQCQLLPAGKICREKQNECDLEEFCNGTTPLCPEDVYVQDGTLCSDDGHCYHKGCYLHLRQCQNIFGLQAKNAPLRCYREINTKGDRFGNCGISQNRYMKCAVEDVLCGRVQCTNVKATPPMPDHTTLIQTHLKEINIMCWGLDYHISLIAMGLQDIGAVKDGTSCGPGMICINRTCQKASFLHYDCSLDKCNKRGQCNNRRHCHCNYGWAPPFCEFFGFGGSIDSGPAGKSNEPHTAFLAIEAVLGRLLLFALSFLLVSLYGVIEKLIQKAKVRNHLKDQGLNLRRKKRVRWRKQVRWDKPVRRREN